MNTSVATNAYRSVKRAGISEGSTPHSLIAQLYQGAIDAISALIDNDSRDLQLTQHHANKGIAIINELQAALHEPATNELAGNLFALYGFIVEQLHLFRKNDSSANLLVCKDILLDLQEAWSIIGPDGI